MANEKTETKPEKKPRKKRGKLKFIFVLIVVGLAMPFMLPTVLLLVAGFIPTYVAFATDDDPDKTGAASVAALNFAGIVPFLIDLWVKGQTATNALLILKDSNSWLIILGAAAIGQLIAYAVPQAIATLSLTNADVRVKALRKNLDVLKDSWGAEVAAARSSDKTAQG
jgi:hypothetical protein